MATRPKKEITIHFNNQDHKIVWYTGTSASDIKQTIRDIVGLSGEARFTLKDKDGAFIPVSGTMPTGEQGHYHLEVVRETDAENMPVKDRVELFRQAGGRPASVPGTPTGMFPRGPGGLGSSFPSAGGSGGSPGSPGVFPRTPTTLSTSPMSTLASKAAQGDSALFKAAGEKMGVTVAQEVADTAHRDDDDDDDDDSDDEKQSVNGPIGYDCSIPAVVSFGVFTLQKESHILQFDLDAHLMNVVRREGQFSVPFAKLVKSEKDPANALVVRIHLRDVATYELWTQSAGEADTIAALVDTLIEIKASPTDASRTERWNFDVKLIDTYAFQPSLLYDPPRENSAKFLHAGSLEMCKNDAFYTIWAVVAPSRMYLFKDKDVPCPFNVIVLRDVRLSKEGDSTFEIKTNFQFFQFKVQHPHERETWLETLSIGLTSRNRTSFPMRKREAELKQRLSGRLATLDVSDEGRARQGPVHDDPLSPPSYKLINEVSGNYEDGFLLCDELMDGADGLSVPRTSDVGALPPQTTAPARSNRRKSSVTVVTFTKEASSGLPSAKFGEEHQVPCTPMTMGPASSDPAQIEHDRNAAGAHYRSEVTLSRLKLNPGQVLKKKFMVVSFQVMKRNDRGKLQARVLQFDLFAKCLKNFGKEELKKAFSFDQFVSVSRHLKETLVFSMHFRGNKPYELLCQDKHEMELMIDLFEKVVKKDVRILDPSLPFDPSPIRPKYVLLSDGAQRISKQTFLKCGFVDKTGSTGKRAGRWMVVSDNRAYIFRNDLSLLPLNVIPLADTEVKPDGEFGFKVTNKYREFQFKTRSTEERDAWTTVLHMGQLPQEPAAAK